MGLQRIVSKIGDLESFGADPRRVVYAGHDVDGIEAVDFAVKYDNATGKIKERYKHFDLEYKGEENNDYVNGQGFCCTGGEIKEYETSESKDGENPERLMYFYNSDHLGSSSLITNFDGEVTQHVEYIPYGEVFIEERNKTWNTPYLFNAKELDEETGLYYYGARYLNPMDGMWLSVDPLFEKYVGMSPYNYCAGNPIKYIDPDGRDAILVVFPRYMVDTETRAGKLPLGHAGILLIDNETGLTKYYEYGRYSTEDGTKGRVRNVTVSNVIIDSETGKPTQESLNKVLGQISKNSGQVGEIQGAYIEGNFNVMNDYAQGKLKESNPQYKEEYNKDRKPYKLLSNNCGTFVHDVVKQDSDAKKKAPWIFNPTPTNIADEYQDNFPKVYYNPNTRTTASDIHKPKE